MHLPKPLNRITISSETKAQLSKTPWCNAILSNPQKYIPIHHKSRDPKVNTEDTFIAETLATDDTFPIWQLFYKLPDSQDESNHMASTETIAQNQPHDTPSNSAELNLIILISTGLNGHPHTLHGGAISLILDEILGHVSELYSLPTDPPMYTAFLNTTYKKPIKTPGLLLGRAWLVEEKSGGRKFWTRGTLEDGEGTVFTEGEALMVKFRDKL